MKIFQILGSCDRASLL